MFTSDRFGLFAAALLGLSAITCGALLLGGWRRHVLARRHDRGWTPAPAAAFSLARTPFVSGMLDVAAEMRDVLGRIGPEAARGLVRLEMAVQPDLAVRTDPLALRALLSDLVGNAIRHAPAGRVLLSAARLGGRVEIAVIDDGAGTEVAMREAALREAGQLVALQGGTLHIEAHEGQGTTVLVRLPEPMGTVRAAGEAPQRQPAQPAAAHATREVAVAERSRDTV
ncbi:MAG TPA: ATP-binding protein [Acetobacteraceae bacterium]|nr:ATP-binding protein [Acetobacteraceae bacterium]